MEKVFVWGRNILAVVGLLALGFWLGSSRTVKAAGYDSGDGVQFQLTGIDRSSSLLVYEPRRRTVYVYQGATTGNSTVGCSYMYHLNKPGGPIQRENCQVTDLGR